MSTLKTALSIVASSFASVAVSNLITNGLMDIATSGIAFKKEGLFRTKYIDIAGNSIPKKQVPYRKIINDVNPTDMTNIINQIGGASGAIGGIATFNLIDYFTTEEIEEEPIPMINPNLK